MTQEKIKEVMIKELNYNKNEAKDWFAKWDPANADSESKYHLFREHQGRALEIVNLLRLCDYINNEEYEILLVDTIHYIMDMG